MRKRLLTQLLAVAMFAVGFQIVTSAPAQAHGWITSPPSRQDQCAKGRTSFDCGAVKYEPQSVEGPKGSMLCSGGSRFTILDDNGRPWPVTNIGTTTTFQWKLTAAHRTTTWQYYVDGALKKTFNQGNTQPPANISHTISGLPTGRHKIFAVWNIGDTANAFYSCIDAQIG
jgi:predicted carbohydrate-binding protein with CBM5 and CBM33 domain